MRELEAEPREVSVAEHYDPGPDLTLAVVHGPFIAPSPPEFEGSQYLVYERGDRPRPEDVSMAEFAENDLALFNGYGVAEHGTEIGTLRRKARDDVLGAGTGLGRDVFDATEYDGDADTDADGDAD